MKIKVKPDLLLFGIMVWVFLSLNATYLNFSFYVLFRWVLPVALLGYSLLLGGKLYYPPLFLLFFVIAIAPSFVVTVNLVESGQKAFSFLLVSYSLFGYLKYKAKRGEMQQSITLFLGAVIIFQVLNIAFTVLGINYSSGRACGFTTNPNTLGIYSNVAIWACYYFYCRQKKRSYKLVYLLIMFLSGFTAIASGSRTAFVVLVLNFIAVFYVHIKNRYARMGVLLVSIVALTLLFTGSLKFLHIAALDRILEEGGAMRGELWEYAWGVREKFPVFGCGYRMSWYYNLSTGNEHMDFHNSYLSFLLEAGIWGVVVFGGIMVYEIAIITWVIIKKIKHNQIDISVIIFAVMLVIGACAWAESFLFAMGSTEAFMFWIAFVWLKIDTQKIKNKEKPCKFLTSVI